MEYVLGFTAGNDISARDWQKQWGGSQWCRGKTFATFWSIGAGHRNAWTKFGDPNSLNMQLKLNGQVDAGSQLTARHDF